MIMVVGLYVVDALSASLYDPMITFCLPALLPSLNYLKLRAYVLL